MCHIQIYMIHLFVGHIIQIYLGLNPKQSGQCIYIIVSWVEHVEHAESEKYQSTGVI